MTLAEKFGLVIPLTQYTSSLPASYPTPQANNFKDLLEAYKTDYECLAHRAFLEGDFDLARSAAQECVRASLDLFHGAWRQNISRELSVIPYDWFCDAPAPLFWASALGDWNAVVALSRYPQVPPKWEWPDHAYFSLVGFFLRGELLENHGQTIAYILGKKAKRPKLLLECLRALSDKDAVRYQSAWDTYCDYFLKHERNQNQMSLLQSTNASFYFAAAKHYGLHLEIPEKFRDYVIQFPQDPKAV